MKFPHLLLAVLSALSVAGCSDDGEKAETGCVPRCEGEVMVTCEADAGSYNCAERGLQCAQVTETSGEASAVCVLSSEPLADCKGRESTCQANYVTTCYEGYPLSREDCDTTNRVCFGDGTRAGCVVSATAEPKCAGAGQAWVCDGDTAIHCFAGRAASKHVCSGCTTSGGAVVDSGGEPCD